MLCGKTALFVNADSLLILKKFGQKGVYLKKNFQNASNASKVAMLIIVVKKCE